MKKIRFSTTIELVLLICFLLTSILFLMECYIGKYVSLVNACWIGLGLLFLVIIFFVWMNHYKTYGVIRRVVLCLLMCSLLSFTVFSNYRRTQQANAENLQTHYILQLISYDSSYQKVSDFKNKKIGFVINDQAYIRGIGDIEEELEVKDFQLIEYDDFDSLFYAMKKNKVQGALVGTLNYRLLLRDQQFANQHQVIHQIEYHANMMHQLHEIDVAKEPFTVFVSLMLSDESVVVANRNDLNFIVYMNPMHKTMHVQMLPSDLYVPNLAYDGYSDRLDRLGYNGMDNVLFSLESMFGFEFDYFMKLNINSLENVTSVLDGIHVNFNEEFCKKSEACLDSLSLELNKENIRYYVDQLQEYPETFLNLFRGFFEKKKALTYKNNTNLFQITNEYVFSDIHSSTLMKMQSHDVSDDWTYSDEILTTQVQVEAPCVSWDFYDLQKVSIADDELGSQVYERYLLNKDMTVMNNFAISLDQIHDGYILPQYNENVVTRKNVREKITAFYTILPNISIAPIEIEKRNDPILSEAHFDPDLKVQELEKIYEKE